MSRWIKFSSTASALLATTLLAAPAFAWNFDDATCAPTEEYEADAIAIPQALVMLDQSYSMLSDNKWNQAVAAINTLTHDMNSTDPNALHFGLGLFTTRGTNNDQLDIHIPVEAASNTHNTIMAELSALSPQGRTPIAKAIEAMKDSNTIQNAPGSAAGILITDGEPDRVGWSGSTLRNNSLRAACEHRAVAPLYVVGFGDGTDEDFNNALAAAGGTGTCENGGDPCASGDRQYDAGYWDDRCEGSIQADDDTALENALNQLADELACTFDIEALTGSPANPEWDDPAQGCTNYDCLKIQLNGTANERVYHESSSMNPTGWKWASSNHTEIRLLGSSCATLRSGGLVDPSGPDIVVTRACMCVAPTGNDCGASDMVPAPGTCECPVGTWTCTQGVDFCAPKDQCGQPRIGEGESCDNGQLGVCTRTGETVCDDRLNLSCSAPHITPPENPEVTCDGLDNDCNGTVDDVEWDGDICNPATMQPTGPGPNAGAGITNRCGIGKASCVDAVAYCDALAPMPEVCNGLDDDCDGVIDNLSTSWSNPAFAEMSLEGKYTPAACFQSDVCVCPDGPDSIEGETFPSYLEGWANGSGEPDPTCICGVGLAP